uniref:Uncharacterized protein n=1 Tax=Romanomermis culicivorax TaxID=13658 RepID=A0A915KSK6_ROMCU
MVVKAPVVIWTSMPVMTPVGVKTLVAAKVLQHIPTICWGCAYGS